MGWPKGKPRSAETRARMAIAQQARYAAHRSAEDAAITPSQAASAPESLWRPPVRGDQVDFLPGSPFDLAGRAGTVLQVLGNGRIRIALTIVDVDVRHVLVPLRRAS